MKGKIGYLLTIAAFLVYNCQHFFHFGRTWLEELNEEGTAQATCVFPVRRREEDFLWTVKINVSRQIASGKWRGYWRAQIDRIHA
jgi:hypothetical protein